MTDFKQEIKDLLNSAGSEVINHFFNTEATSAEESSGYSWFDEGESNDFFGDLMGKRIDFVLMDSYGGEGEGEDYWSVYKFTKDGKEYIYVKFHGWYQSYVGSEFDEWFFVKPKQVTVTQFVRI